MPWHIQCCNDACKKDTWAGNIDDLLNKDYLDADGWILCQHCHKPGYIKKEFKLQEEGGMWRPYLKGVFKLGDEGEVYQPFVFLVSYAPDETPMDVWFCYYKDTRPQGGKLKMGYGPGGPPVLGAGSVEWLVGRMRELGVSF